MIIFQPLCGWIPYDFSIWLTDVINCIYMFCNIELPFPLGANSNSSFYVSSLTDFWILLANILCEVFMSIIVRLVCGFLSCVIVVGFWYQYCEFLKRIWNLCFFFYILQQHWFCSSLRFWQVFPVKPSGVGVFVVGSYLTSFFPPPMSNCSV